MGRRFSICSLIQSFPAYSIDLFVKTKGEKNDDNNSEAGGLYS
jgi:hypothetical protein